MQRVTGSRHSSEVVKTSEKTKPPDPGLFHAGGNAPPTLQPQHSRVENNPPHSQTDPAPSTLFPVCPLSVDDPTRGKTSNFIKKSQESINRASRNWHSQRDEQTGNPFGIDNLENIASMVLREIFKHKNDEESIQVFNFLVESLCSMHREKSFTLSEVVIANIVDIIRELRSTKFGVVESWYKRLSIITRKKTAELNGMPDCKALIAEQIETYRTTAKLPERIDNQFAQKLSLIELRSIFKQDPIVWNTSVPIVIIMLNRLFPTLTEVIDFYCKLPLETQCSTSVLRTLLNKAKTDEECMSIHTRLPEAAKDHPDVAIARLKCCGSEEEWMNIYASLPEVAKNHPDVAVARLKKCSSNEECMSMYAGLPEATRDDPKVVLASLQYCSSREQFMSIYAGLSEATKKNPHIGSAKVRYDRVRKQK